MGRYLNPVLRRELENLDKDADSRKSAMKALKSYVKDLDSKYIPLFLAQVSETKEMGASSGEYTISLYEVLARVHGRNIVPQIDNILASIIRTLASSASSFPLHQACAKVVPAIARYGIEHSMLQEEKAKIIGSLCQPLSDVLMSSPECLASGAALCLKALVETDNWRFASCEIVNALCLKVAGALEDKPGQTNAHMGLAMALSKHNSLIVEAYARSLLRSGLQILAVGIAETNSQKRFEATQMINFLMKCVDSRSIFSELANVIEVMENCSSDPMPFVQGAAFEALQTAKIIAAQKGLKHDMCPSPKIGSNFIKNYSGTGTCPRSGLLSPESRTIDSFLKYDSFAESPLSIGQSSYKFEHGRRANRRLWNEENGGIDVSLKDGLYSISGSGSNGFKKHFDQFDDDELQDSVEGSSEDFSGFAESRTTPTEARNAVPDSQRPRSPLSIDDVKFTTPRKLIRSLQNPNRGDSECINNPHVRISSSPATSRWSVKREVDAHIYSHNLKCSNAAKDTNNDMILNGQNTTEHSEQMSNHSESVSSSGDVLADNTVCRVICEVREEESIGERNVQVRSRFSRALVSLVFGLSLVLPAIVVSVMWTCSDDALTMVPT